MKANLHLKISGIILTLLLLSNLNTFAQITLLSPNGGETWVNGNMELIAFEYSGNGTYVAVEYSADNGNYYQVVEYLEVQPGTNDALLYVNYPVSDQARMRVSDVNNPALSDESDAAFTVTYPAYTFYTPYYGDVFYQGLPVNVQWNSLNGAPTDLELSADGGNTWQLIATGLTVQSYTFTAPEVDSDNCVLKLSETANPENNAISYPFSITPQPQITVTSPNGGEVWNYNDLVNISWTGSNLPDFVTVDYSLDNGLTWINLWYSMSDPDGGTDQISVPQASSSLAKIRISLPYHPSVYDESDNVFTIVTPPFIIYSPQENSRYYTGQPIEASWYSFEPMEVDVALSTDGGITFETIETNIYSQYYGYSTFNAPAEASANCVLKVSKSSDPSIYTLSSVFQTVQAPVLSIVSPNGGEIIDNDSSYEIVFDYDGETLYYTYLQIDFSNDNGQTWQVLDYIYYLGEQNSYTWQTPASTSAQCLIRITDYYYPFITATSASPFRIEDFPEIQICMVGVDTLTGKNMIAWNKPVSSLISEYVVLKEGNQANQYDEIAAVPADEPALFIDLSSNPREKATRYKITFRDEEGNLYPAGDFHQTMHLTISKGVGESWNLIWSPYLGFDVESYNIYRGATPSEMELIGTVSGNFTSYSDFNALPGFVYYMVEVINPNDCSTGERSQRLSSSMSNIATNYAVGMEDNLLSSSLMVYPNPATEHLRISLPSEKNGTSILQIRNMAGSLVVDEQLSSTALSSGTDLNVSALRPGIYTLMVISPEGTATKRFVKK